MTFDMPTDTEALTKRMKLIFELHNESRQKRGNSGNHACIVVFYNQIKSVKKKAFFILLKAENFWIRRQEVHPDL